MEKPISSKWYEKNLVLFFGGVTILAIFILNYFLIIYLERKNEEIISYQLEANFNTTVDRLREWRGQYTGEIDAIISSPTINERFNNLILGIGDEDKVKKNITESFNAISFPLALDDYSIFNLERKLLLSNSKDYFSVVSSKHIINSVLDDAFKEKHGFSHPVEATREITGPAGALPKGVLFQLLCSQIINLKNNNEMTGYLCLRFNPQTTLFPIFKTGLVGATGESYAIKSDGTLITSSRFSSSKNIIVEDGNLSYYAKSISAKVHSSTGEAGELTEMAKVVAGNLSRITLFNYPDYRGVNVVGTGGWLEDFDFGVIVEQDWDEAFQTFLIARKAIFSLSTAACILIFILCAVFSYNRYILALRELRFRSLLRNIPTPVYIKDEKGHFVALNPAFEVFTKLHREDLLGEKSQNLPIPYWLQPVFENDTAAYSSKENKAGRIIEITSNTGELKYYKIMRFSIINDSETQLKSVVTILMDTTDRILASERLSEMNQRLEALVEIRTSELKDAKEKAEMASRAKAEFLANMSHEIRTPLNTILGLAHVALNSEINDNVKTFLEKMRASGKHLLNIINDILNFSRLEVGKLELDQKRFNIIDVVDDAVSLIRDKAKYKNLELHVDCDPGIPPTLIGDPLRLSQILINFCANAIKFTDKGSISLIAKNIGLNDNVVNLEISVRDTGIGIDSQSIGSLFQPFSQVDNSSTRRFEGSGLGLAISKNLADLMNATIDLQTEKNVGSCFTIKIALKYDKTPPKQEPETVNEELLLRELEPLNCQLLLVEDNQLNREVTQELLQLMGAIVEPAASGEEALIKIKQQNFDIVLMDIQMPGMDGTEATRLLRELNRELPIVATTANALLGDREWYLKNGFSDYLSKPFEPLVMRDVIIRNVQQLKFPAIPGKNTVSAHSAKYSEAEHKFEPLRKAGIDTPKALMHLMNNASMYTSALKKFSEQRANFIVELDEYLANNKAEEAINHVHSLASLAAMLGMTAVSNKARRLEDEFMQNKFDKHAIGKLSHELRGAITLIRAWLYSQRSS